MKRNQEMPADVPPKETRRDARDSGHAKEPGRTGKQRRGRMSHAKNR